MLKQHVLLSDFSKWADIVAIYFDKITKDPYHEFSPIRNLKAALHLQFPDTYAIRGGPERVQKELEERLKVVWSELDTDIFEKLILSMPDRVRALYDAKGWYTRY